MTERLSVLQPIPGQIVLHCKHSREPEDDGRTFKIGTHWFKVTSPFETPSGATGVADWLNACEPCYAAIGWDLTRLAEINVRGHIVWDGDAPVIVEDVS